MNPRDLTNAELLTECRNRDRTISAACVAEFRRRNTNGEIKTSEDTCSITNPDWKPAK